jgi:hypothetical protein
MSKYWNTSGVGAADWLWTNLKQNPEGLLFLAAGCALLLRRAPSTAYAQHDREHVENSPRHRELVGDKVAHQSKIGDWANEASSLAEKAREHASSVAKKMSETADDYTAAVSEYALATREKVTEQSRRLAEKGQRTFQSLLQEQPLAVALVGLAAGAAVAAALPATTPERRVLGPARQRLYEAAAGMARENITEAAVAAGERLKSVLKEGGLGAPGEPANETAGEQNNPPLGARDASHAESGTDQLRSDPKRQGEESSEEAKAAKAILDAQQKAVDDIRAGRPAPYYFTPPRSAVRPLDTAPSSASDPHIEKSKNC